MRIYPLIGAYTALAAATDLVNTEGLVITPTDNIDAVNGNKYPWTAKTYLFVYNGHATGAAIAHIKVQRRVKEDGVALSFDTVDITIPATSVMCIGGFSATNFRNTDGDVEIDWTFSGGAAASDVDILHATL